MQITLRPTDLVTHDGEHWLRVWRGTTDSGIHVCALVQILAVVNYEDAGALLHEVEHAIGPDRVVPLDSLCWIPSDLNRESTRVKKHHRFHFAGPDPYSFVPIPKRPEEPGP